MALQAVRSAALVLALLLSSSLLCGANSLSGVARVLSADLKDKTAQRLLVVKTADGTHVPVHVPDQRQLAHVRSGMQIEVAGRWQPVAAPAAAAAAAAAAPSSSHAARTPTFTASSIKAWGAPARVPQLVRVTSRPQQHRRLAAGVGPAAVTTTLSSNALVAAEMPTIIIPMAAQAADGSACPGSGPSQTTTEAVRRALFAEQNPAGPTVGSLYAQCSYGKTRLTAANSLVVEPVTIGCAGVSNGVNWTLGNSCEFNDFDGWAVAADEAVAARGIDLAKYKHRVYLLPPAAACAWVGLAYTGCDGTFACRAWIASGFWTSVQAIAHELGHNLGMGHAGKFNIQTGQPDPYGDSSCVMGHCCDARCPNTPHAWQLGWLRLQQLDGASLAPGTTVTASLASQSASDAAGLRLLPSWAPGAPPLWVGYRTRAGGDAQLWSSLAGRVHLYAANITSSQDFDDTEWLAALAPNEAFTDAASGLVIQFKAATAAAATVTVCNPAGPETRDSCSKGQDNDCNGQAGADDPACVKLLASVLPPVAPPRKAVRRPPRAAARKQA